MEKNGYETATFAGGCFWCTQSDFDKLPGVISTTVGYTGGKKIYPTYDEVSSGRTGHVEATQVIFDPKKISYEKLLEVYWHSIEPTRNDGQFCDIGSQYRPVIFYHSEEQRVLAEKSKNALKMKPVKVDILPAETFYSAEEYHQKYYKKKPSEYEFYRSHSGREK
ncbi:MAG TPA: peptide-methionine (S)-S-oxide reductase MsrA [Rhabdochlamydiaceae bacterium]|nr:peptide-methionine (S)-S-oxide reductase MsrA [Rhabdochlamydiaceae bacterium]